MSKNRPYVIFVRHGKAEPYSASMNDFDRRLTDKGISKLNRFFPQLAALMRSLLPEEEWTILTSPKYRALETAEILCGHISNNRPVILPALADADLDSVIDSFIYTDEPGVVLVGHQPMLSDWLYELTGRSMPFRKGAAVAIRLDTEKPRKSECLWMLDPM